MTIQSFSGVSWLHDRLIQILDERATTLAEGVANGVPEAEYRQFVGRYRECKRFRDDVIPELFIEFYKSDEDEEDDE